MENRTSSTTHDSYLCKDGNDNLIPHFGGIESETIYSSYGLGVFKSGKRYLFAACHAQVWQEWPNRGAVGFQISPLLAKAIQREESGTGDLWGCKTPVSLREKLALLEKRVLKQHKFLLYN